MRLPSFVEALALFRDGASPPTDSLRAAPTAQDMLDIGQNIQLFSYLCDGHLFSRMHEVFTDNVAVNLPEDHFRNLNGLDEFLLALDKYGRWPFQHAVMSPLIDFTGPASAHAESMLIATVFDSYDATRARVNEVEYGSYISDHRKTPAGWKIYNLTARPLADEFMPPQQGPRLQTQLAL